MSGDRRHRPTLPPRDEVRAELEHHVDELTDRLVESGMSPPDAREEALRRFGSVDQWQRTMERSRRFSVGTNLRAFGRDLRHGLRQIRRHPVFSTVAILTLAAGIGGTTAIFSAAKQVLRPDLPFRDSDAVVRVYQRPEGSNLRVSPRVPLFMTIRDAAESFASVAGSRFTDLTVESDGAPERAIGNAITPGWLQTLGVQPVLGRPFTSDEEAQGESSPVVLISHSAWQRRFGGSADVVGQTLRLSGLTRMIVGVLPAGFDHPYGAEFWIPLSPEADQGGFWALNIKARLAPGRTHAQAAQELEALAAATAGTIDGFTTGSSLFAVPIREALVGEDGQTLSALMLAVGFLLLIVCANLANLLVARSVARSTEFALRASLGASRWRLLQQALGESLVLAGIGGLLGVLGAVAVLDVIGTMLPENLIRLGVEPRLDGTVLTTALLAAGLTGLAVGALPGLSLARRSPAEALKATARGQISRGERRMGRGLAVGELALTLVLLTSVGLLVRDFQTRRDTPLGYTAEGASIFTVSLDPERYASADSRAGFVDEVVARLTSDPAVERVGATNMFPRHQGNSLAVVVSEEAASLPDAEVPINHRIVSDGYLAAMGVPVLQGRGLESTDVAEAPPVAVVSASLAQRFWPGEDPLGRRLRNARAGDEAPWITVVGVVDDLRESDEIEDAWYLPFRQHAGSPEARQLTVLARGTRSDLAPSRSALQEGLGAVDGGLALYDFMSVTEARDRNFDAARHGVWVGTVLGLFGLFLAALGIYGTVGYFVSRRMREFGVRRALGASHGGILSVVVREVGALVALGGAVGLVGTALTTRLLARFLVQVGPFDTAAYLGASGLVALAAVAAALAPTIRAIRVDPILALRAE